MNRRLPHRAIRWTLGLWLTATLAGCASLNTVSSEVATYRDWPAGRLPGRYAFERLPSQQVQAARQAEIEASAAQALEGAGFTPASDPADADVIVQIGARVTRTAPSPWDDPLWWHWGAGYWRGPYAGAGWGPYWGAHWRPYGWGPMWRGAYYGPYSYYYPGWYARYERGIAVLLRDRRSGAPLYEAHALTDGMSPGDVRLISAMFEAALKDFPATGAANPRIVTVPRAP